MTNQRFTQEEQDEMHRYFLVADPEQVEMASIVAGLLAEEEEDSDAAYLALKFYYSLKENKGELDDMLDQLNMP